MVRESAISEFLVNPQRLPFVAVHMEEDEGYVCTCGRSFTSAAGLHYHRHGCKGHKRLLSDALVKVKQVWMEKRPCLPSPQATIDPGPSQTTSYLIDNLDSADVSLDVIAPGANAVCLSKLVYALLTLVQCEEEPLMADDLHLSVAVRKPKRQRVLPARYKDIFPQPPPPLPPGAYMLFHNCVTSGSDESSWSVCFYNDTRIAHQQYKLLATSAGLSDTC